MSTEGTHGIDPGHTLRPERAVLMSLLLDAVDCFLRRHAATTTRQRHRFADAEEWLFDGDPAAPFSFENVCRHLAIDAECLRGTLHRWRDRQPSRHARTHHCSAA
jgi:hypothetical protein